MIPNRFNPVNTPTINVSYIEFNIIIQSASPKWFDPRRFGNEILYLFLMPGPMTLLDLTILLIVAEKY
jgi:hypothetical protein